MTGADFTYQTSQLPRGQEPPGGTAGRCVNRREDLEGEKRAYGFGVLYPNDRWNFGLTSARIGDGFDPSFGFVPRRAFTSGRARSRSSRGRARPGFARCTTAPNCSW